MKISALYLRTVTFGVNDSLISTVGFLAGISVTGVPRSTIALVGIIYIFVEAFSMAMGDFLSEKSVEEYISRSNVNSRLSTVNAILMFISCVLASLIPLIPYIIFTSGIAFFASIFLSVFSLFIVGVIDARLSHLNMIWRGVRMASLGGAAIVMGVTIGLFMPTTV